MKLSSRGRYAVMAMADIAQQIELGNHLPIKLNDISKRQQISLAFLEQIFGVLRQAELVASTRGKAGGYMLARPMVEISIADIVLAVEEPVEVTRCAKRGGCLKHNARCLTHDLWDGLGRTIKQFLQNVSLADIVTQNKMVI